METRIVFQKKWEIMSFIQDPNDIEPYCLLKWHITSSFELIKKANVEVNYFNVGGGFPTKYPNMKPKSERTDII